MNQIIRYVLASIFAIVLIVSAIFIFVKKDEIFRNEVLVTYEDGCVEKYVNAKLVTPACIVDVIPVVDTGDMNWSING